MSENKTPLDLWVEALRSGKYPQTTKRLHDAGGYCCLGVACEVYNEHHEEKLPVVAIGCSGVIRGPYYEYGGESHYLPEVVRDWIGLRTRDGWIGSAQLDEDGCDSLASLNDKKGLTFAQIADFIERHKANLLVS